MSTYEYNGTVYTKAQLEGFYDSCNTAGDSDMTYWECCTAECLRITTTLSKAVVDGIVGETGTDIT